MEFINFFLDWYEKSPYLSVPLTLWVVWIVYTWHILHKEDDIAKEKRVYWLKEDKWSSLYLNFLGKYLKRISVFIGDENSFIENKKPNYLSKKLQLDYNPWTENSFIFSLKLALIYPTLSIIIFWVFGFDVGYYIGANFLGKADSAVLDGEFVVKIFSTIIMLYVIYKLSINKIIKWKLLLYISIFIVFIAVSIKYQNLEYDIYGFIKAIIVPLFVLLIIFFSLVLSRMIIFYNIKKEGYKLAVDDSKSILNEIKNNIIGTISSVFVLVPFFIFLALFFIILFGSLSAIYDFSVLDTENMRKTDIKELLYLSIVLTISIFVIKIDKHTFIYFLLLLGFSFLCMSYGILISTSILLSAIPSASLYFINKRFKKQNITLIIWSITLTVILLSSYINVQNINYQYYPLFLLLMILPVINAPFDWISLGVTRGLLSAIEKEEHKGFDAIKWVLYDIAIALFLFFFVSLIIIITISVFSKNSPEDFAKLGEFFKDIKNNYQSSQFYWYHFLVFSTLIPTLIHFSLAGAAVTTAFPKRLKTYLVGNWEKDQDKIIGIWFYISIFPVIGFIIAPLTLLVFLYVLINNFGDAIYLFVMKIIELTYSTI